MRILKNWWNKIMGARLPRLRLMGLMGLMRVMGLMGVMGGAIAAIGLSHCHKEGLQCGYATQSCQVGDGGIKKPEKARRALAIALWWG